MPGSALDEYSRNYGEKLRSALGGGMGSTLMANNAPPRGSPLDEPMSRDTGSALESGQGPYVPQDQTVPREPGGTTDPTGGDDMGGSMAMGSELGGDEDPQPTSALGGQQKKGFGFREAWKEAPEEAKKRELTKLEESLKRGNQTIDDAYDDLEKQMGTPPEKKKKLSREEKGMILMEFGLNMLANNRKGLGAIGEAGGRALNSYRSQTEGPYQDYQQTKGAVAGARAGSKVKLAEQSALESIKQPKEGGSKLPGRFNGEDGFVYFYDEDGNVKKAVGDDGKPIKADPGSEGGAGRGFESDAKYKRYMEIYGVDAATGKPLSGIDLQQAKQDALDFANDRGNSIDDLDLDIQAETSADKEMGAEAYRDLTPDQREAQRSKIAEARRSRLRRPQRSRMSRLGSGEPGRGHPSGKRKFASEADAKAAFERGDIKVGDTIIVNGVEGPVE